MKGNIFMFKKALIITSTLLVLASCTSDISSSRNSILESQNTSSSDSSENKNLNQTTLFLVGDSTVSSFNDNYYYPRYGYGTQIGNYLDKKVTVNNLALSGRSSKSFLQESNYQTLKSSLKSGDYLMIGFGHNDEKEDDSTVYTNPTGDVSDNTSFKYYLYNNYIKMALDKGATPILCTPIVRANQNNDYTGSSGHITSTGDYSNCIKDLGTQYKVTTIDLTSLTKNLYTSLGYDEAINFHAWTTSNKDSVDKTHLNIYGAKEVSYLIASELKKTTCSLKDYVLNDISAPTKNVDLVSNPNYVEKTYTPFNASSYNAPNHFKTTSEGWYGTAFGDTGGSPSSEGNGYVAKETEEGKFLVGQTGTTPKGKISSSSEGFALLFRQIAKNKNFTLSADIEVKTQANTKQAGFGLMIRDDVYVNLTATDSSINSNSLSAGLVTNENEMNALFYRENTKLTKENNVISGLYAVGDKAKAKITRTGQNITLEFIYKEQTYTKTFYDFDVLAIDNLYFYVGVFATRGTTVECTNLAFVDNGDATEA